jgi:hypothetical protein
MWPRLFTGEATRRGSPIWRKGGLRGRDRGQTKGRYVAGIAPDRNVEFGLAIWGQMFGCHAHDANPQSIAMIQRRTDQGAGLWAKMANGHPSQASEKKAALERVGKDHSVAAFSEFHLNRVAKAQPTVFQLEAEA